MRTADSLLVLLTDQSADYRALESLNPALDGVRWQVTAQTNWSTSRVFVWGELIVLGTSSGDIAAYCEKTGVLAWSRTVGPVRAIGGAQDILLAGTRTGDLFALRAPRSCNVQ